MRENDVPRRDTLIKNRSKTTQAVRGTPIQRGKIRRRQFAHCSMAFAGASLLGSGILGRFSLPNQGVRSFFEITAISQDLLNFEARELGKLVSEIRSKGFRMSDVRVVAPKLAVVGAHFTQGGFDDIFKAAAVAVQSMSSKITTLKLADLLSLIQSYDPSLTERDLLPRRPLTFEQEQWLWNRFQSEGLSSLLLDASDSLWAFKRTLSAVRAGGPKFERAVFESDGTRYSQNHPGAVRVSLPGETVSLKHAIPSAMGIVAVCGSREPKLRSALNGVNVFLALTRLVFTRNSDRHFQLA
jgi:hypothetical protein